ncbi:hypothetical protein BDA96_01G563700 [Sorghum bicolor]|uniref:Uncharacterized protein n=1 Tax=Sorghum bicolor TaxID=4558 RepID=A0A921S9M8_SORBI|nr:hypothetical protein BDA96_01G563700 [Sorghum bicolor]
MDHHQLYVATPQCMYLVLGAAPASVSKSSTLASRASCSFVPAHITPPLCRHHSHSACSHCHASSPV